MIMAFLDAIGAKLKELYPERLTYFGEVPQGIDGNFAVKVINITYAQGLDRRRISRVTFDVMYFLKDHDTRAYHNWQDLAQGEFELLRVGNELYHTQNRSANITDRIGHLLFDVVVNATLHKPEDEKMQKLSVEVIPIGEQENQ